MATPLNVLLADLMEEEVIEGVRQMLSEGLNPQEIFAELQKGMTEVGERYQGGEYFLPEMLMAADIFKTASGLIQEKVKVESGPKLARMVLGTVAGDIHDIGKNIVSLIFSSNGFEVIDIGVDVPPERFVAAVKEYRPQLVGLSCLLTVAFDAMKATVEVLERAGLRQDVKILIGGGSVTEETCQYVGADRYCPDAPAGVRIAKEVLGI
ncbi:Cobalamin (vitamin B12)-binding domain [Moorella glycerini]|uniref:Methionine synthase n=1 Tax=Neomoorella stamsii TaxID=1266720 RepID=A0A9X7J2S0_9FIRM|nr:MULTISPECIES: cobalamin-dependent protein [Moorella]PRR71548.1 Methionine synthase [Moorella stamsii]CEP66581.1 Cobalamin (vitamin B12)-binding domain [Moorella glycerini]